MSERPFAADAAAINAILARFEAGTQTADDLELVLRGWRAGQLNVDVRASAQSVAAGGNIIDSTITIAPVTIHGAGAEAIRRELERLTADRYESSLHAYSEGFRKYARTYAPVLLRQLAAGSDGTAIETLIPQRLRQIANDLKITEPPLVPEQPFKSITDVMQLASIGNDSPHICLIGGPGAGKSTLFQQLAANAWDAPTTIGFTRPHLVMLVRLRWLAQTEGASWGRLLGAVGKEGAVFLTESPPEDFFPEWSKRAGAPWLLLLDGLDEVPQGDSGDRLIDWLDQLMDQAGAQGHHVVLSTRPTGRQSQLELRCATYEIQPFDPEQRREFASRAFGADDGETFLEELDRVRAGTLGDTPLLLAIAAAVRRRFGELPPRRAALYDRFVDVLTERAKTPDVERQLGSELSDPIRVSLEYMAQSVTENSGVTEEGVLVPAAAKFLQGGLGMTAVAASASARRLVDVVGRHSGILQCFDEDGQWALGGEAIRCQWLHQTFREFLTATAVARRAKPNHEDAQQYMARWSDPYWREIALFLLGAWSSGIGTGTAQDVSAVVEDIIKSGVEGRSFAAAALAEGAAVSAELADRLITDLVSDAQGEKLIPAGATASPTSGPSGWDLQHPVEMLGWLKGRPRAREGLRTIGADPTLSVLVRTKAVTALGNQDQPEEALRVVESILDDFHNAKMALTTFDTFDLMAAVVDLPLKDEQKLAPLGLIANDKRLPPFIRLFAILAGLEGIGAMAYPDMSVAASDPVLVAFCENEENRRTIVCSVVRENLAKYEAAAAHRP